MAAERDNGKIKTGADELLQENIFEQV